jgi:putative ABC transport system substrate-binding protein
MRRRQVIKLFGGATAAWPLAALAQQQERMRRIGVLMHLAADDPEGQSRLAAFLHGLEEAGWAVGRNVTIDVRWAAADGIATFFDAAFDAAQNVSFWHKADMPITPSNVRFRG